MPNGSVYGPRPNDGSCCALCLAIRRYFAELMMERWLNHGG